MSVQVEHKIMSSTGQWFVVNTSPASGSPTVYTVVEGTEAQALSLGGGTSGPYASEAQADKVAAGMPENSNQPNPYLPGTSVTPGGQVTGGPLSGLAAIGDFFSRLTQKNTWVRVGEVLVGVILLGIGVNAMFKGRPLAAVTGAAGTVGKVVP